MGSQAWNDIVSSLNPKYVLISWATGGDTATIYHCDNDGVTGCTDVTTYLDCTVTSSTVTCKVPTTLGFSTYKVSTSTGDGVGGGGGGGGGGGLFTAPTASQSQLWDAIQLGATTKMSISNANIPITSVSFGLKNKAQNADFICGET